MKNRNHFSCWNTNIVPHSCRYECLSRVRIANERAARLCPFIVSAANKKITSSEPLTAYGLNVRLIVFNLITVAPFMNQSDRVSESQEMAHCHMPLHMHLHGISLFIRDVKIKLIVSPIKFKDNLHTTLPTQVHAWTVHVTHKLKITPIQFIFGRLNFRYGSRISSLLCQRLVFANGQRI